METIFSIRFSLKTLQGIESFASFSVGNNRERAINIFQQLRGRSDATEKDVLFIDFMEITAGLPLNCKMMTCTLAELGDNCRIITKELFKLRNIESEADPG